MTCDCDAALSHPHYGDCSRSAAKQQVPSNVEWGKWVIIEKQQPRLLLLLLLVKQAKTQPHVEPFAHAVMEGVRSSDGAVMLATAPTYIV